METNKMLHLTPPHAAVPGRYAFPADRVPPATSPSAAAVSLPVVDMSGGRDEVCRAILDAGKEMGFFQVVNHGVAERTMRDMESVCDEFFRLPAADKADLCSDDARKPNRLFTGALYGGGRHQNWRDCLRLACAFPDVGDSTADWPAKPHRFREVAELFTVLARHLATDLLRLLCHSMSLRPDYFDGDLSGDEVILHVNHYPPCPDPSATLGQPPHCDRGLITVLLPGAVPGLEVAYKGSWIRVEPVPGALVVNFGLQLEVVTNGVLRSVEHRAVTNSSLPRTSVALFVMPAPDCLVGPAEEFLGLAVDEEVEEDRDNPPPRYRTMTFGEFSRGYAAVNKGSSLSPLNITTDLKSIQKIT